MNYDKIAPALAAVVDELQAHGRSALRPHAGLLGLVSTDPAPKPARVVVFLEADADANLDHLSGEGLELNQAGGRIRTGIVALEHLDQLSEDDAVLRISPARRLGLHMDVAPARVGVPAFRDRAGLTGAGVVVGIVDSGIEALHPAFAGRILRVWDQTLPGPGVAEGAYGAELTGDLQQVSRDTIGHGTHVAGIAVGSDPTYGGVAPGAELIMVKTDLLDAHVADGIRYVFRVAKEMGRPAVVNLSLGGHGDAHDGTDPLSTVIDTETGPGRVVCCSAGNEGIDDIHAQVQVGQGRSRTLSFSLPAPASGAPTPVVAFNGWYGGGDEMAVAVVSPGGTQTPFQRVVTSGSPVQTYRLPEGSVRIVTPGPDPTNGDHNFFVDIKPFPPSPSVSKAGAWRIRLRGERVAQGADAGRVDVWSIDPAVAQFTGRAVRDSVKVGSPGAASKAVTVASYTTKVQWYDVIGGDHSAGLELHDVSDFSSEGPRRDSVEKPDLTAPGAMIASSLSVHSGVPLDLLVDDMNTIKAGTSMASPFVAGVVALLLERDPTLDPDGAKALLRARCSVPGQASGTFDPKWGYGLLDATGL